MKKLLTLLLLMTITAAIHARAGAEVVLNDQIQSFMNTWDLEGDVVHFTGGQKYPVYTGPGEAYLRSANGKAIVSTNDWIQVFGREDGWILIQYAIDRDHYRIGYISEKSLPKSASVKDLGFQPQAVYLNRAVSVTDDPLYSGAEIAFLSEGARGTLLGTMDTWAYIEAEASERCRGFVPLSALTAELPRFSVFAANGGGIYDWFTIRKLYFGTDGRVAAVSGFYERLAEDEECYTSEKAPGSDRLYPLAGDFHADMLASMTGMEMKYVPVTDLAAWYIDAYREGEPIDHEWIFTADLTDEQLETVNPDFWFVTTQIELNERDEIRYMRYVYVPWG